MASRTFAANKSSLFADGSSNLGGGADDHLPVGGPWNGYTFISAVRFALDFTGMKRITAAKLRLRTSTQVHVGFSSAPDFYIARATGDWTANSSSSSSEGGSGWGTSPTVYPGPSKTSTGQVSKRSSTSESVWVEVDISAIVRAWAPASVEGGGSAANYGIRLDRVASGDITEFLSYKASSNRPEIVVTYDTDAAPVATMDGPTGVTDTRPVLTGHGIDTDGDPIDSYYVEVLNASSAVVYSAGGIPGGASFGHTPTIDLPPGPLTARCTCGAGGLSSAWSNSVAFTVDRPPAVGAFSAPVGATGVRRPPITFATSDPDGDTITAYDVAVYVMAGGVPSGPAVYVATDQTAGISAGSVTHTPLADLPGGTLGVQARVRSGPVNAWSVWSGYQPFTITLTAPTLTWIYPATDGAYVPWAYVWDLANPLAGRDVWLQWIQSPPAGQTITNVRIDVYVGSWYVAWNGAPAPDWGGAAGGHVTFGIDLGPVAYMAGRTRVTLTASLGGVTVAERGWKAAALETRQTIVLGDQITDLALSMAYKGAAIENTFPNDPLLTHVQWIRAQSGPDTAVGDWYGIDQIATVQAQLPAANAHLGVLTRYVHLEPDTDLITNGSFEAGIWPWYTTGNYATAVDEAGGSQPDGTPHRGNLFVENPGPSDYPSLWHPAIAVIAGAQYRLGCWESSVGTARQRSLRLEWRHADGTYGGIIGETVLNTPADGVWRYAEYVGVAPAGCAFVEPRLFIYQTGIPGRDIYALWDTVTLIGPAPGASGLDRLELSWKSLG